MEFTILKRNYRGLCDSFKLTTLSSKLHVDQLDMVYYRKTQSSLTNLIFECYRSSIVLTWTRAPTDTNSYIVTMSIKVDGCQHSAMVHTVLVSVNQFNDIIACIENEYPKIVSCGRHEL